MAYSADDKKIVERMQGRLSCMTTERASFVPHWQEISSFITPRTSRYLRSERNKGHKYNQDIINETAVLAHRTLESGMMAGMSSSARPWFGLAPPDPGMKEFGPVKTWLDTVTRAMRDVFARGNLYSVLPKTYGGIGGYGTAAFGLIEDEKEVIRCYPFPIGSFLIDCNARMTVDTIYREYSMTVRQVVEKFGLENCSVTVKNLWAAANYGAWVDVVHAIEPNFAKVEGKLSSRDKAYISVYFEVGNPDKMPLSIKGYDEFPAIVSRWHVNGEDAYGSRCPGMDALGSVKALQLEERWKLRGIEEHVRPAVNADSTLRNTGTALLPGGVNWINGMMMGQNPGIRPVRDNWKPELGELREDIAEVENRIKRCFFEDLMLMFATSDKGDMTAREVEERHGEKLLVLGPMMEQQNDDTFDPIIDRTFNIMMRRGMFPPPPEELQGQPLRVEYVSVMAQAQKLVGLAGTERFLSIVGRVAEIQVVGAPVLAKVDFDQVVDEAADMCGVSAGLVFPDDVVAERRAAQQEADQAQKMAEAAPAMAQGAQAAKTLSETDTQGQNALTQLMAGMTG